MTLNYQELKCIPDAATDSLQRPGIYEQALELQHILKNNQFLRALPRQYKIVGEPLFVRSVNSVIFTVPLYGDRSKKGECSAIVKFHNRFAPHSPEFGDAAKKYAKMAWCRSKIGELTFPRVAKSYASGMLELRGVRVPWSMEERLPGKEVAKPFDPNLVDLLWEKTGAVAASISKIRPSGYGGKFDPEVGAFTETWDSYLNNEIASANLSQLAASSLLTAEHTESLRRTFEGLRTLDRRYPAALSHRDLAPHNNIFWDEADLKTGTVLGVIDFEQAASVPGPVYEIAMTQWYGTVFNEEIRLNSLLRGMGFIPENVFGTQLERDYNAVLMLKLSAHISLYLSGVNEEWDPQQEALPRMVKKLTSLLQGVRNRRQAGKTV